MKQYDIRLNIRLLFKSNTLLFSLLFARNFVGDKALMEGTKSWSLPVPPLGKTLSGWGLSIKLSPISFINVPRLVQYSIDVKGIQKKTTQFLKFNKKEIH